MPGTYTPPPVAGELLVMCMPGTYISPLVQGGYRLKWIILQVQILL
jgi:hypothetical protein